MKGLFALLFLPVMFFGYAQYSDGYPMVKVKEYLKGVAENQIGLLGDMGDGYSGYSGPTGFAIAPNGGMLVNDTWNSRIVSYDKGLSEKSFIHYSVQIENPVMLSKEKDSYSVLFYLSNSYLELDSRTGKVKTKIQIGNNGENDNIVFFKYNDVYLIVGGRKLASLPNPGPDPAENNRRILNEAQTRALFKEPEKYGLVGVTLDSKNRLFVNGELQTRDYITFFRYWNDKYRKFPLLNDHKYPVYSEKTAPYIQFIGKDLDGNIYWCIHNYKIQVFNKKGIVIDLFEYDGKKSKTLYRDSNYLTVPRMAAVS